MISFMCFVRRPCIREGSKYMLEFTNLQCVILHVHLHLDGMRTYYSSTLTFKYFSARNRELFPAPF